MPFLNLPSEIQQQVLSYLLWNRDLVSLSLQCRALHSLCNLETRKRFHRIRVTASDNDIERAFGLLLEILQNPHLGQYVRCLECWESPPVIAAQYDRTPQYQRHLSDAEMTLMRAAVQRAGFTGPEEEYVINMLMQKTARGDDDDDDNERSDIDVQRNQSVRGASIAQALAAILVVVSPNLVSMDIARPFSIGAWHGAPISLAPGFVNRPPSSHRANHPLDRLFRRANFRPEQQKTYLQNLQKVYLINRAKENGHADYYVPMDLVGMIALFDRLPSIECVAVDFMKEADGGKPGINRGPSNISRISIRHSSVSTLYIARTVASFKVLKEFRYSIGGRRTSSEVVPFFNPKGFIKLMCKHRETLEILDVDVDSRLYRFFRAMDSSDAAEKYFDEHESPFEPGRDPVTVKFLESLWGDKNNNKNNNNSGSLKNFVALRRLSLGIDFLLYFARGVRQSPAAGGVQGPKTRLVDCLPNSLEYICVRGYQRNRNKEHDIEMDALKALYMSGLSRLKELKGLDEMIPNAEDVPNYAD